MTVSDASLVAVAVIVIATVIAIVTATVIAIATLTVFWRIACAVLVSESESESESANAWNVFVSYQDVDAMFLSLFFSVRFE